MTGNDLLDWLSELWYDIIDIGRTDLFSIAWRLLIVFLVLRLVYGVFQCPLKRFMTSLRRTMGYFPRQIRQRHQKRQRQRDAELWAQREQEERKQEEADATANRQKAADEREVIQKSLSLDD